MAKKEVEQWITVNGKHIPIFKGESKEDAVNRAIAKENDDKKEKDIARNKEQADKLNGKQSAKERDQKFIDDLVKDATSAIPVNGEFNAEDLMSNGDIQSVVEAYALMYKGVDEEKILNAVRDGIEKLLTKDTPPDKTGYFWNNGTIDKALQWLKNHPDMQKKILGSISNNADRSAIQDVMKDGWAERFDRYDSDVAEQFLNAYEKLVLKKK